MKIKSPSPSKKIRISDTIASEDNLRSNREKWTHKLGSLTTQLDLEKPHLGISIKSDDSSISILGICLPKQSFTFSDGWFRGNDATAVYAVNDARQLQTSGLWRLQGTWCPFNDRDDSITAELILSSETLRERSDGSLAVECSFAATSAQTGRWSTNSFQWERKTLGSREYWSQNTGQTVTVQCFVFQLAGFEHAIALFTRSDEIHHTTLTSTPARACHGQAAHKHMLKSYFFPTIIEKGVLHRGRILAVLGPSQSEKDWCTVVAKAFAQQPPLLQ